MANNKNTVSRRQFIGAGSAFALSSAVALTAADITGIARAASIARSEPQSFKVLNAAEVASLDAITARLIPTTDTPGAREAGVVHFFDQALGGKLANALDTICAGLADIDAAAASAYPETTGFRDLPGSAQDAMLRDIESSIFFQTVLVMTKWGFFAMSRYGGNRDQVGWRLIGYDGHHGAWTYPFGYYDAEVHGDHS